MCENVAGSSPEGSEKLQKTKGQKNCPKKPKKPCKTRLFGIGHFWPMRMERITGLEPATFALARRRSTKWAKSANPSRSSVPIIGAKYFGCGASGRNRTNDTGIFSPLLYQLSYRGIQQRAVFVWRPEGDSNPWPLAWQASVLTNWTTGP